MYIILNAELTEGVPEKIQIVPLGQWTDHPQGPFKVSKDDVLKIISNADDKANDIVIDYEHQTLKDVEAPAAGWIKEFVNNGEDGLFAKVEWTERAKKYLKNKEYKYLSPVLLAYDQDEEGWNRPSVLHSAALTNTPFIDGMKPIVNKFQEDDKNMKLSELIKLLSLKDDATEDQVKKRIEELIGLKDSVIKTLDLKEDISDEELAAEISKLEDNDQGEKLSKKIANALEVKPEASESEVVATIHALKQSSKSGISVEEFNKLKNKIAQRDRDSLVELAMKKGKITPAQKDWAEEYALEDPEGFKVFIDKAPVVVPVDDEDDTTIIKNGKKVNDVQAIVNKNLGVDEESFNKHNKKEDE